MKVASGREQKEGRCGEYGQKNAQNSDPQRQTSAKYEQFAFHVRCTGLLAAKP